LGIGAAKCPPAPEKLSLQVAALPILGPGSSGPKVALLQHALNVGQNAGLKEDGGYGPKTVGAIRGLQHFWGQVVDGIEGPVVRRFLAYELALRGQ
jgi:peptidoglycan hydrolase-like protein with peptidoglycan-binding domain